MKNKERLNLMLERLDRIDRILNEKLESSCKEGKSCREEDIDDLESMDEGIIDAVKGLVGKPDKKQLEDRLEAQSDALAKKITSYLGTPLNKLIEVTPRGAKMLNLQGMGCTIRAKDPYDKYTVYIYTPKDKSKLKDKSKPSYMFISETEGNSGVGKNTHVKYINLKNTQDIVDYIKDNLSNFTKIDKNKIKIK